MAPFASSSALPRTLSWHPFSRLLLASPPSIFLQRLFDRLLSEACSMNNLLVLRVDVLQGPTKVLLQLFPSRRRISSGRSGPRNEDLRRQARHQSGGSVKNGAGFFVCLCVSAACFIEPAAVHCYYLSDFQCVRSHRGGPPHSCG